ncbi:MAG: AAA family ATPase, partial [Minisyncoccales bacterium]
KNLLKMGSVGRDLAEGFTVTLDNFSWDLFYLLKKEGFKEFFAHLSEVEELERILAGEEKNDVLIVGESGSGRRSIVEAFARKSFLGQSLENLNHQRILYFDLTKLIASSSSIEQAEFLIDRCFFEAVNAGNVILVFDNLHNFIGVEGELGRRPGTVEISGILGKYISNPAFRFIGITNFEGLHRNIEKKPELLQLVQKIEVKEVTSQETLWILQERVFRLEKKYNLFISFPALREIVSLTDKYLPSLPFPEKAINLLDELMVILKKQKKQLLLPEDVARLLAQKTEIPLAGIEEKEKEVLLNLEKLLHNRIVDQNEAISHISNALRRARTGVHLRKGPMGSFLFLGPTGVGKTETAKALAEIYFGSEEKIIRLDMSEFQRLEDISRLLGKEGQEGLLTTPVRENPFSLLLLDEFEKGHRDIFNLFLQVLDEGHLTDGWGRKVDFRNTIIIATSNAGYQIIFEAVQKGESFDDLRERLINFFVQNAIFRPELLNRFDGLIVFRPLSQEDLLLIADFLLKKLQKKLKEKEINFVITDQLKERIVKLSYKPEFGAREMQRVIQEKIGNSLARFLLEKRIEPGTRIEINPQTFEVIYNP